MPTYQPLVRVLVDEQAAGSRQVEHISAAMLCRTPAVTNGTQFNDLDTNWHHYAFTFSGAGRATHLYRDGIELVSTPVSEAMTSTFNAPDTSLYIGYGGDRSGAATAALHFNGYIDELRIYDVALTTGQMTSGFEVRHADFHGHLAQYTQVLVPEQVTSDAGNRLYAAVHGGALDHAVVLADHAALAGVEEFLLDHESLQGSANDYVLTAQLKTAATRYV
jgi:hypothetical protein